MITFDNFIKARAIKESWQANQNRQAKNLGKRTKDEELEYGKDSNFNFVYDNGQIAFMPGIHGPSQARDRRPDMSKDDWKKMHRKVFWYLKDNNIKTGVFLFFSKELNQGYIASIRRPRAAEKEKVKAPIVVGVITVLPRGRNNPTMGSKDGSTQLALMEEIALALGEEGIFFESVDCIKLISLS